MTGSGSPTAPPPTPPPTPPSRRAVGQVLIAVYAVFAVSAGARAAVQIATRLDEAPVAYLLSAFAAAVYLVATVAFRLPGRAAFLVALVACSIELAGVLTVGTATVLEPDLFADATVWTAYGRGYGFVPLVLPVLGLAWLRHVATRRTT
ncbi:hypothetical protein [Nocardioides sp.]|uniref:hypothetical protein n=1 Tax=Nocardioides sp. TaxID=35761 RepID=UPI0027357F4E|nr:hypothetical protein [Nocardioides sp.]MDP3890203.1 hypothetical protein [Nocardioides sp.]